MPSCLCDRCAALCCRYFALPLDNPTTARDYDNIRWYLMHEQVVVYIEKKQWYLAVLTRCKNLQPDNRCGIYPTRPRICRDYSTDNCDYHGGDYGFDRLFTSAEELEAYAREQLGRPIPTTVAPAAATAPRRKAQTKNARRIKPPDPSRRRDLHNAAATAGHVQHEAHGVAVRRLALPILTSRPMGGLSAAQPGVSGSLRSLTALPGPPHHIVTSSRLPPGPASQD